MTHQVTRFSDSLVAWESWNLTDFAFKSECLHSLKASLQGESILTNVLTYHLEHASALLADSHLMPGPTGETNELYTAGRGVALLIHDSQEANSTGAVFAQVVAALSAGNTVILCSDNEALSAAVNHAAKQSTLPEHVIQVVPFDAYHQVLESNVRSVGYVGNAEVEHCINRQLSKRDGAIVGLVSETDLVATPVALDPHLVLRFITERTRTINITAVGGNATLLELGNDPH